ncbi:MAG TPA: FAD-dependent oxidoreductase [Azonexus sp.]|nr:FAD-dependent oxidoreductase [Azonexus sp.]
MLHRPLSQEPGRLAPFRMLAVDQPSWRRAHVEGCQEKVNAINAMLEASNGTSTSLWMDNASIPDFPPLQGGVEADVCVIGAGIAGLTTAYLLAQAGKQVVLIEALGIGAGETGRTTAHFFPPDEWYAGTERSFGVDRARQIADSFARAIDLVESIVEVEQIDCQFVRLDGYLYALPGNEPKDLRQERDAAVRAGLDAEYLERVPGLSFDTGPCVRYRHQAQFHPLQYLGGLARAFVDWGGKIYCHTRASSMEGDASRQLVATGQGAVRAGAVVVCTNTPFNNRVVIHTKQAGYRTYVVGMRIPKASFPRILLWDSGDPYYYVRLATPDREADHDLLVVGGADHKVGQDIHPEHRYAEIERWVRERFPFVGPVDYRWSGEVMEPADGPAFLGRNPMDDGNVYVITGDSGNGMSHCNIGAMLVRDLILGISNPWQSIYDPARKAIHGHGLTGFVTDQANTLAQYRDWLTGGEVDSAREIAAGDAAIVRDGPRKLAVFRDEGGELHVLSAQCTHLGCLVHWNSAERSWDCPCHGSRFDVQGRVLHGPAPAALDAVALAPEGHIPAKRNDARLSGRRGGR